LSAEESELYKKLKQQIKESEFLEIQEKYLKDDQKRLKYELVRSREELKRIQAVPLTVGYKFIANASHFVEMIDENYALINSSGGSNLYVRVLSTIDREKLKANTSIALHRHSQSVVDVLPTETDSSIQMMHVTGTLFSYDP
jgi:26S proteasome regulatory subunit T3